MKLFFLILLSCLYAEMQQDSDLLLSDAISHHQMGDIEKAAQIYQKLLNIDPQNNQALHLLGVIYAQNKQFDEALTLFHKALKQNPNAQDLLLNIANVYIEKKEFAKALKCYRYILLRYPDCKLAQKQFLSALEGITEKAPKAKNRQLLLGLGSGRCGTTSLTMLWHQQTDCFASHESAPLIPWEISDDRFSFHKKRLDLLMKIHPFVGEVSSSWLPYFDKIVALYPNVKAIVLQRDRKKTISSFFKITGSGKKGSLNHWIKHDGTFFKKDPWDQFFPTYDCDNIIKAIGKYWDEYYETTKRLCEKYPDNIRIFPIDALNDEDMQRELLQFCGFSQPKIITDLHLNKGSTKDGSHLLLEGSLF